MSKANARAGTKANAWMGSKSNAWGGSVSNVGPNLWRLNPSTGAVLWSVDTGGRVTQVSALYTLGLVAAVSSGRLVIYDEDGIFQWDYGSFVDYVSPCGIGTTLHYLLGSENPVAFGSAGASGNVTLLDSAGNPLWVADTGGTVRGVEGYRPTSALSPYLVYAFGDPAPDPLHSGEYCSVFCYDRDTGSLVRTYDAGYEYHGGNAASYPVGTSRATVRHALAYQDQLNTPNVFGLRITPGGDYNGVAHYGGYDPAQTSAAVYLRLDVDPSDSTKLKPMATNGVLYSPEVSGRGNVRDGMRGIVLNQATGITAGCTHWGTLRGADPSLDRQVLWYTRRASPSTLRGPELSGLIEDISLAGWVDGTISSSGESAPIVFVPHDGNSRSVTRWSGVGDVAVADALGWTADLGIGANSVDQSSSVRLYVGTDRAR